MEAKCSAPARDWLTRHTRLAATARDPLAEVATALLERLPEAPPWRLGLGGPPGTGKSTLARLVAHLTHGSPGAAYPVMVLSLDDYYLPADARRALAGRVHPLLSRRGVPGTHDTRRLFEDLEALARGGLSTIDLPRFDKGRDDRDPAPHRVSLDGRPVCVILEGWFVGTPPEAAPALAEPINGLEREQDPDARWRHWVNERLGEFHAALAASLGACWHLAAPDWASVLAWRWQQERERPPEQRGLGDEHAVADFLAPFERLCRHQFAHARDWANPLIRLDRDHRPHLEFPP